MEIRAYGKYINTAPIERIFTQGEAYSDKIIFIVDSVNNGVDVSGCTFVMRTVASDDSMTETILEKSVKDDLILLTWHVPDTATAVAGMLQLEIIGSQNAQLIIKYMAKSVYVKEAIFGENIPAPDVVEAKLAEMNEILASANAQLEEAKKKLEEAQAVAVTIDATLSLDGQAADAKAAGTAIAELRTAIETAREDIENIQTSSDSIQEVVDARHSNHADYTYSSLGQRLNAEFGTCVRQSAFEQRMSALAQKDSELEKLSNDCLENAHSHNNQAVLDAITAAVIQNIVTTQQKAQANAADIESLENRLTVVNSAAAEALNKADACLGAAHGHDNKSVIDTITSNNIAAWNSAANDADRANERLDTIDPMVVANQTNITALQAAVENLQNNGVKIAATAGEALNKANASLSGLSRNADLTQTTIGTPLRKNLLPYPSSITKGGVTFTCDENGYMSCSTPDADKRGLSAGNAQYSLFLRAGTYVLSFVSETVCTSEYGYIWVLKADGTQAKVIDITNSESGFAEFTIDSDQTIYVFAKIFDGKVAAMIRYASITDGTYEPYTPSIQEQIDALRVAVEALGGAVTTNNEEV